MTSIEETTPTGSTTSIVEMIRKIAETEVRKHHLCELGVVTSVFPHSSESDNDNYDCSVRLKDRDLELRKVPVATQQIGLANIPHVGDLVLLEFVGGDFNSPVIIGRLYNDEDRPPTSEEEEIVYAPPYSKSSSLKRINIKLPGGKMTINIQDEKIGIKSVDVEIACEGDLNLKAKNVTIESDQAMVLKSGSTAEIKSGANMTIKGSIVNIN